MAARGPPDSSNTSRKRARTRFIPPLKTPSQSQNSAQCNSLNSSTTTIHNEEPPQAAVRNDEPSLPPCDKTWLDEVDDQIDKEVNKLDDNELPNGEDTTKENHIHQRSFRRPNSSIIQYSYPTDKPRGSNHNTSRLSTSTTTGEMRAHDKSVFDYPTSQLSGSSAAGQVIEKKKQPKKKCLKTSNENIIKEVLASIDDTKTEIADLKKRYFDLAIEYKLTEDETKKYPLYDEQFVTDMETDSITV